MVKDEKQEKLLNLKDITIYYNQKRIIERLNIAVAKGEILVIVGESGCGKSTLLKAIIGLMGKNSKIASGEINFQGKDLIKMKATALRKFRGAEIAMIFQEAGASFCPIRKVRDQLYETVAQHKDWSQQVIEEKALLLLDKLHLSADVLDEYPFCLSGGMSQRIGILFAMIMQPQLILADEPTSALDAVTQVSVAKEFLNLRDTYGSAMIVVTHHIGIAQYIADNIAVMKNGCIVEYASKKKIFEAPREAYTKSLIKAAPMLQRE
ncbi:MAG: oppD3 [Firmicutes bacterium]|nr:oppD3 [Bacillota bacterium]